MSEAIKNDHMQTCPQCGNHCPVDALRCGRGRKYFGVADDSLEHDHEHGEHEDSGHEHSEHEHRGHEHGEHEHGGHGHHGHHDHKGEKHHKHGGHGK